MCSLGRLAMERLITMKELPRYVAYSRAHIMRLIAEGKFPKPLKLGPSRIAWRESVITEWQNNLR